MKFFELLDAEPKSLRQVLINIGIRLIPLLILIGIVLILARLFH